MSEMVQVQSCLAPARKLFGREALLADGGHDSPEVLDPKAQMSLCTQIEQILSMPLDSLCGDAAAVAKISRLDPYLLQSCCERRMSMTLTAMLRSAGVFDLTSPGVHGNSTGGAKSSSLEPRSVPLSGDLLPDILKSVLTKLSVDSFEVISVETNGSLGSIFCDSDFDTDSLMECEISYGTNGGSEDYELLDSERYRYAGAFNRLKEQHDDISNTLRSSQLRITALEEQNKRDLDYLRKASQSGEIIRDKVCEMKSEMSELGGVLDLLKDRTATKNVATLKRKLGVLETVNKPRHLQGAAAQHIISPLKFAIPEVKVQKRDSPEPIDSIKLEHIGPAGPTDPAEPSNPLRLFVNSTIVVLIIACWI